MAKNKKSFSYAHSMFFGFKERMTQEQDAYVQAMLDPSVKLITVNAKAGTGKTSLAVAAAKILVDSKCYQDLLYVFAPVEENQMGYTPGDVFEKEKKYHGPLLDALEAIGEKPERSLYDPTKELALKEAEKNKRQMDKLKKKRSDAASDIVPIKEPSIKYWVTALSHTFLRGRNLMNRVVIIDEAQNFTLPQLRKILTRCHDNCKVILIGHTGQCDIDPALSGFKAYIEHAHQLESAKNFELTQSFRGELAEWADQI